MKYKRQIKNLLIILVIWVLITALYTLALMTSHALRGEQVGAPGLTWWGVFYKVLPDYMAWAVLTPLIVWLGRKIPVVRRRFIVPLLFHATASFAIAYLQIFILLVFVYFRTGSFPGPEYFISYFPWLIFRDAYVSVSVYWTVLVVDIALHYYNKYRRKELQAARLEKLLAEARDQMLKMQPQPPDEQNANGMQGTGNNENKKDHSFAGKEARLAVKIKGRTRHLRLEDIDWIEGADYYVNIHCGEESYLHRDSLKNLSKSLPPDMFVRIHLSAIVNLKKVKSIKRVAGNRYTVVLQNDQELDVSRRRKNALLGNTALVPDLHP